MITWGIVQCVRYILCGGLFYLGYVMLRDSVPYGGWVLVLAALCLVFGGHSFSRTSIATCPKCGHSFKIEKDKKDANTAA